MWLINDIRKHWSFVKIQFDWFLKSRESSGLTPRIQFAPRKHHLAHECTYLMRDICHNAVGVLYSINGVNDILPGQKPEGCIVMNKSRVWEIMPTCTFNYAPEIFIDLKCTGKPKISWWWSELSASTDLISLSILLGWGAIYSGWTVHW